MQVEPSHYRHLGKTIILFPGRDGLLREHLASFLVSDGNAVTHRATQYLLHRIFLTLC